MHPEERRDRGLPAEVLAAHRAAVRRGDPMYPDPTTGLFVMTEAALLDRGACCGSGCRHCPYDTPDGSAEDRGDRPDTR